MQNKLFQKFSRVYLLMILSAPLGYLIRIFLARNLSVEEYGLFYALLAFITLLGSFNDLGMNYSLAYFLPKYIKEKALTKIRSAVIITLFVELFTSLLLFLILLIKREDLAINLFNSPQAVPLLPIFGSLLLILSFHDVMENVFKGYLKDKIYSSFSLVRLFSVIALGLSFFLVRKENLLIYFSIAWIGSFLITILIYLRPLLKLIKDAFHRWRLNLSVAKELTRYGFYALLGTSGLLFWGKIDTLMIAFFKGVEAVALYEIALPLVALLTFLVKPLKVFLFPHASHLSHSGKQKIIKEILQVIYSLGLFIFLPLALLFVLFPQEIIQVLFGVQYLGAQNVLRILSVGYFFGAFFGINRSIIGGIGLVKQDGIILFAGGILNIGLNILLIPVYGIEGSAVGTAIGFMFMFFLHIFLLKKKLALNFPSREIIKIVSNACIFLASVLLLKSVLELNIYLEMSLVMIISLLIYMGIGFWWKIINYKQLKNLFKATVKK